MIYLENLYSGIILLKDHLDKKLKQHTDAVTSSMNKDLNKIMSLNKKNFVNSRY